MKCRKCNSNVIDCMNCINESNYRLFTNADNIRNMSDEQLAKFLRKTARDGLYKGADEISEYLKWLKQEVDE